ncbi:MAG: type II toxin-antitoxin system VapC family toxin [Lachnospiraceae bacterium]|nr:type II toxin-antitoxin system VapC family toxin [Lachnospiraceae bacterium]
MQHVKNTLLIDANVILRYLLNDHEVMSQSAKKIIEANSTYTKPEIIAEVVYVLFGVYKATREDICIFIHQILKVVSCTEAQSVSYAIDLFADSSLDFVDCLIAAYSKINNEQVYSFDKKLNKMIERIQL